MVRDFNKDMVDSYEQGLLSPEALMESLEPLPQIVPRPSKTWCSEFRLNWGWSMLTRGSSDAQWLGFPHPDMQSSREQFAKMLDSVNPLLILNFDQVWRNSWSTSAFKMFYKPQENMGKRGRRRAPGPREDKKVHHVKGSRRPMTVSWHSSSNISNYDSLT
jgi:hypothetical protein